MTEVQEILKSLKVFGFFKGQQTRQENQLTNVNSSLTQDFAHTVQSLEPTEQAGGADSCIWMQKVDLDTSANAQNMKADI